MKKRYRVVRRRDFQAALAGRRLHGGRLLVAFAVPRPSGPGRVGVAVSRQIRGAVRRNRARRRLREAVRLQLIEQGWGSTGTGISFDVVLIARPAALDARFADLEREVAGVRARLEPR